jgi:hypothetical protein
MQSAPGGLRLARHSSYSMLDGATAIAQRKSLSPIRSPSVDCNSRAARNQRERPRAGCLTRPLGPSAHVHARAREKSLKNFPPTASV